MQLLERFNDTLLKVAGWGTIFFMAVIAIVIPYEVFGRYILARMSTWSGEVATFSLVWASMLGAAVGLKKGYQVGMTAVLEQVPMQVARLMQAVGFIFSLVFLALMTFYGADQALENYRQLSPAMQIPMTFPYLALPVGFSIMFCITVEQFLMFLGQRPGKEG